MHKANSDEKNSGFTQQKKPRTKAARAPAKATAGGHYRAAPLREDWLAMAKDLLIREGIASVKVDRLARLFQVTRGGFYWRFEGHADLLDALLADWQSSNTGAMLAALNGPGTPFERFQSLMNVWIEEKDFIPAYDMAIREWARVSPKVARVLRKVDEERIEAFRKLFLDAGYSESEATIRARVTYYHQLGYYAMGVQETKNYRREMRETYYRILTGFP